MTTERAALRTLIVDDEPLAVERLQVLCARLDDIVLVGTAGESLERDQTSWRMSRSR
jgi:two-component system response regulator AlgR